MMKRLGIFLVLILALSMLSGGTYATSATGGTVYTSNGYTSEIFNPDAGWGNN